MRGTENLFRRFLSLASAKVAATVIAVLSTPVIVRLLGPGGYGDYAVLLSIYSLYMIPISGTITEGVQKFVGESRDLEGWTAAVIRFYLVLGVGVMLVGAAVLLAVTLAGWPERLFGPPFGQYFLLLVPFVVISQFRALGNRTVLGFGFEHLSGPLSVIKKLSTVSFGIAMVLVGYGVAGMLVGHIVAELIVALLAGGIVLRQLPLDSFRDLPSLPYRELLSFNVINVGIVLLSLSLYHVDIVMLRGLTDAESTGFYKAALAMAEYLWFIPLVIQQLLLHSTSELWANDRVEEISELASRVTRQVILLVVLLSVGLATLAPRVMGLYYGAAFVVATTPLVILLPGTIAFAAARPLKAITQGSGRVLTLLGAIGAAATVNLVLNALLIPRYGMVGAAVATSIGYTSMLAFVVLAAYRVGFDPFRDLRPWRIAVTAVVAAVPIVILDHVIVSDLLALSVVPPVGLVVYVVTAIAIGALDSTEVVPVLKQVPDPVGDLLVRGVILVER